MADHSLCLSISGINIANPALNVPTSAPSKDTFITGRWTEQNFFREPAPDPALGEPEFEFRAYG